MKSNRTGLLEYQPDWTSCYRLWYHSKTNLVVAGFELVDVVVNQHEAKSPRVPVMLPRLDFGEIYLHPASAMIPVQQSDVG